jgi:hypothetical protein
MIRMRVEDPDYREWCRRRGGVRRLPLSRLPGGKNAEDIPQARYEV